MKNKKHYRSAKPFFQKLLKDRNIRIQFEEEKSKTEIAYAVRTARIKADLTQAQLAKLIGTSQSVIARLEGGTDKRVPSIPLLARIAAACGAHFEFGFIFSKVG
jgi:DNA-binding XRE family transcriptional regulator